MLGGMLQQPLTSDTVMFSDCFPLLPHPRGPTEHPWGKDPITFITNNFLVHFWYTSRWVSATAPVPPTPKCTWPPRLFPSSVWAGWFSTVRFLKICENI